MIRGLVLSACVLACAAAHAGHGFLNAFADVAPLPAPGRTPDQATYALDGLAERARLAWTDGPARFDLLRDYATEKLAELVAMVRREAPAAADVAAAHYASYLDELDAFVRAQAADTGTDFAARHAQLLLEHQYLASLEYLDLPATPRPRLAAVMAAVGERYTALVAGLPRAFRDAQFFKEEEVRWSWEMARQADAQGL